MNQLSCVYVPIANRPDTLGRHGLAPVGQRMLIGTQSDKAAMRVWCWERDQAIHRYKRMDVTFVCLIYN